MACPGGLAGGHEPGRVIPRQITEGVQPSAPAPHEGKILKIGAKTSSERGV